MKRTRYVPLHRFRKQTRFPLASLLYLGALAAPLFLTGCDDRGDQKPFSTISQCQQEYNYTVEHCRQIYGQAIDKAKIAGKPYASQSECIQDNYSDPDKQSRCQYTSHGTSAHYFFVPRYYSYSPGSYAEPFYKSPNSSSFRSTSGESFSARFARTGTGGFSRSSTVSRGGFGHIASSHSSGHSSGG